MSPKVCTPLGGEGAPATERPVAERRGDVGEAVSELTDAAAAAERCLAAHPCTYCEVCQLLCPDQCITRDPKSGEILIDLKYCKGCGVCAFYCPKGALRMELETGG